MKKFFSFLSVLLITLVLCSCSQKIKSVSLESDQNKFSCNYNGTKRSFYLFLPEADDYRDTKLVIMLHGYGSSAKAFLMETGFEKDAQPKNYAVIYINGIPNPKVKMASSGWNYNYDKYGKSDMNFIVDLVQFIQKNYGLSKKCYVVGFSNGAFMTTKLAVEKSKYFDAFVSVGGMMPENVWNHRKNNKNSVNFFQINGTKDAVTPMRINDSAKYNPNPAMEDVIDYFANENNVSSEPNLEILNDKIKITKYENSVWWMLIKDYPHSWPSNRFCELNINEIILDFFLRTTL